MTTCEGRLRAALPVSWSTAWPLIPTHRRPPLPAFAASADGPAFFAMSIAGILIVGLALWVEFAYTPSLWLHMLLWLPLSIVLCLALVRPLKALMIALQYQQRAEEG